MSAPDLLADAEVAEKRTVQRRQLRGDVLMIGIYSIGGLWLSYDVGIAIWHWQFWMISCRSLSWGR